MTGEVFQAAMATVVGGQTTVEPRSAAGALRFPLERRFAGDRRVPWGQTARILARLQSAADRPALVFLEGGHFDPRFGADDFSKASLDAALDLGSHLIRVYGRRLRVVFGVLQDDLGLDCAGDACSLGERGPSDPRAGLPDALEARLAACRYVKRDRVEVFRERAAKNRGISRLRRILAAGSVPFLCEETAGEETRILLQADDGQRVLLACRRGAAWVASCPLIMAQHYADVVSRLDRRFSHSPVLLIDYSRLADRNKVERGAELALRLMIADAAAPCHIINVFYADDAGQHAFAADLGREDFMPPAGTMQSV
jgi:hypothetical protein